MVNLLLFITLTAERVLRAGPCVWSFEKEKYSVGQCDQGGECSDFSQTSAASAPVIHPAL